MTTAKEKLYAKRGEQVVKNLRSRHFDAYYCATKEEALEKALELIPKGASVGWGGTMSSVEIGLLDAVRASEYHALDRDSCNTQEERDQIVKEAMFADVFLASANALSLDGQMVSIDGCGNRAAAIIYGPKSVLILAGMNKITDTLEDAIHRARTIAAPMNKQRFAADTPCYQSGICHDCKSEGCICNHIVVTRHCRPAGRIKFIIVGDELGF